MVTRNTHLCDDPAHGGRKTVSHFRTVIIAEPLSGGLAESVAVTMMVCDPEASAAVFREYV